MAKIIYHLLAHPNTDAGVRKALESRDDFKKMDKPFLTYAEQVTGTILDENKTGYCFTFATDENVKTEKVVEFLLEYGFGYPKIFQAE